MAIYRTVCLSFWTDPKVVDDFTPEDRYFYLYLFTNPHTNLSGCYEISKKQMAIETGYTAEKISKLLKGFITTHKIIDYDYKTKEVLLLNWYKYNWTTSEKFRKPLKKEIEKIKNDNFRVYLSSLFEGENAVYGIDTNCIDTSVTVTVTDTVTDTVSDTVSDTKKKHKESYGANGLVKLTIEEYERLKKDYGTEDTEKAIEYLDGYIADKGYKSKDNNQAIRRWVIDAVREKKAKIHTNSESIDDFFRRRIGNE